MTDQPRSGVDRERVRELKNVEDARFAAAHPRSAALIERGRAVMPNGVPMAWQVGSYHHLPMWVAEGKGTRLVDVDGNVYVDFNIADLSMFCGYAPEPLLRAVSEQMARGNQFLLPTEDAIVVSEELARRFRLENVGHSAGVFDPEKLAWVNRHYLKAAAPARLAQLAIPYLRQAGWVSELMDGDLTYLESVIPIAAASVDRLEQIPARLSFLFDYSADRSLQNGSIAQEAHESAAVIESLARELETSAPLLDRDAFRAMAKRVQQSSGAKGKALFHPIRLALTGEAEGIELDIAVPAIERGAQLSQSGIRRIVSAGKRAAEFAAALRSR